MDADMINEKGELLVNILKDLNKADAFICVGVSFNATDNGSKDELASARYGEREEIISCLAYLLAEEAFQGILGEVLAMCQKIIKTNDEGDDFAA